jgi:hypothetical protein
MPTKIFRERVPLAFLFELLEKVCLKTDKYYLVDYNAYRKFMYMNLYEDFVLDIIEYYYEPKQYYVTREMNYNSFINIIRQISKSNQLMFTNQVKYVESKYCIEYLIYY